MNHFDESLAEVIHGPSRRRTSSARCASSGETDPEDEMTDTSAAPKVNHDALRLDELAALCATLDGMSDAQWNLSLIHI